MSLSQQGPCGPWLSRRGALAAGAGMLALLGGCTRPVTRTRVMTGWLADFATDLSRRSPETAALAGLPVEPVGLWDDFSARGREEMRAFSLTRLARIGGLDEAQARGREWASIEQIRPRLAGLAQWSDGQWASLDPVRGPQIWSLSLHSGVHARVRPFVLAASLADLAGLRQYAVRLKQLGAALDDDTAQFAADAALGVVPPLMVLDALLARLSILASAPASAHPWVAPALKRLVQLGGGPLEEPPAPKPSPKDAAKGANGIAPEPDASPALAQARTIAAMVMDFFEASVRPALQRQKDAIAGARAQAGDRCTLEGLPDGKGRLALFLEASGASPELAWRELAEKSLQGALDAYLAIAPPEPAAGAARAPGVVAPKPKPAALDPNLPPPPDPALVRHQGLEAIAQRVLMRLVGQAKVPCVRSELEADGGLSPAVIHQTGKGTIVGAAGPYWADLAQALMWGPCGMGLIEKIVTTGPDVSAPARLLRYGAFEAGWRWHVLNVAAQSHGELGLSEEDRISVTRAGLVRALAAWIDVAAQLDAKGLAQVQADLAARGNVPASLVMQALLKVADTPGSAMAALAGERAFAGLQDLSGKDARGAYREVLRYGAGPVADIAPRLARWRRSGAEAAIEFTW